MACNICSNDSPGLHIVKNVDFRYVNPVVIELQKRISWDSGIVQNVVRLGSGIRDKIIYV